MWKRRRNPEQMLRARPRSSLLLITILLAFSTYIEQVYSLPAAMIFESSDPWPTFPRRNVAALARNGYLRQGESDKRSISTLAKNGQLPTLRAPYDRQDGEKDESDDVQQKRNIQALARDGYRFSKSQQNEDKRSLSSLARNGYVHKRDRNNEPEFYFPFFQNLVPEIDGPFDPREMYDYQQSVNPDMFPPLDRVFKRSGQTELPMDSYANWFYKRGDIGMPMHGLFRSTYSDPSKPKRYILSMPDYLEYNDVNSSEQDEPQENDKRSVGDDSERRDSYQKRHIGSLARLGLLPSFRYSGGRYSRSGRARLRLPSQEMYRKHSSNENFGIRQYFPSTQANSETYSDDTYLPAQAVPPHAHPTGRILNRPLNNDIPLPPLPVPPILAAKHDPINKNRWQSSSKEVPKFYYFRSNRLPYHRSGKRYLILPAFDKVMLRKNYPNSSLPSRRKNQ